MLIIYAAHEFRRHRQAGLSDPRRAAPAAQALRDARRGLWPVVGAMAADGPGGQGRGRAAGAGLPRLLEIEPISVSRLLDRMEEGGWISRRQDASDRRVRMIFPTDKSRKTFGEVKSVAGEVYEQAMAGLSAEQRRALIARPATDRRKSFRTAKRRPLHEVEASKEQQHERSGQDRSGATRSKCAKRRRRWRRPPSVPVPQPAKPAPQRRAAAAPSADGVVAAR